MARYHFELWNPPWDTFTRKSLAEAASVPVGSWQVERNIDKARETVKLSLPTSWAHMADLLTVDDTDHANDVAATLRVYRGGSHLGDYLVHRRAVNLENLATGTSEILAKGVTAALEKAILYPHDYPADPTADGDWKYGAEPINSNQGFEGENVVEAVWLLTIDDLVTGGSFTLTVAEGGPETTGAISYTGSPENIALNIDSALTATTYYSAVEVEYAGTDTNGDDTWRILLQTPNDGTLTFTDSLTGGTGIISLTEETAGTGDTSPWVQARNMVLGTLFGTYATDGWRITDQGVEPVRSGLHSLFVNGTSGFVGPQAELSDLVPGQPYQVSVWVWDANVGQEYRISVRGPQEELIAWTPSGQRALGATSTWVEYPLEFTPGEGQETVAVRFTNSNNLANPTPFYVDDFTIAPGMPQATWGDIALQVMADAQTDHSGDTRGVLLDWITPTWTTTLDSAGVAWPEEHSVTLPEGANYLQVFELGRSRWGYEFQVRWDEGNSRFEMDLFLAGGMGTVRGAASTLVDGSGITGGERSVRAPTGNAVFVRGAAGAFSEVEDTASSGVWERVERYVDASDVDASGLASIRDQQLDVLKAATVGLQFTLAEGGQVDPFVDVDAADTVPVTPSSSSGLPASDRRVAAVKATGVGGEASRVDVHISSEVFGSWGMAAQAEAIRRLIRQLKSTVQAPAQGGSVATGAAPAAASLPWLVAAPTSPPPWQDLAGFVGDGTSDLDAVQASIDYQQNFLGVQGTFVVMAPGAFYHAASGVSSTAMVYGGANQVTVAGSGMGGDGTYIEITGSPGDLERVFEACTLQDLYVQDNTDGSEGMIGAFLGSYASVTRCQITVGGMAVVISSDFVTVQGSMLGTLGTAQSVFQRACVAITQAAPEHVLIHGNFLDAFTAGRWLAADSLNGPNSQNDLRVIGNKCINIGAGYNGFDFIGATTSSQADGILVAANHLYMNGSGHHGISLVDTGHARVFDNEVHLPGRHGIYCQGGDHNRVHRNTIWQPSQETANTYDGVHFDSAEDDSEMVLNTVVAGATAPRYGVRINAASCDRTVVWANILRGTFGTSAYSDAGTATINGLDANGQLT